jgi:hypothetical protein
VVTTSSRQNDNGVGNELDERRSKERDMTSVQVSAGLVLHHMTSVHISAGLALHQYDVCTHQCRPRSSSLWRLNTSVQASFFKEKKSVRLSALYLQKKRSLLIYGHSHQQDSCSFRAYSVFKWIGAYWSIFLFTYSTKNCSWQAYAIFEGGKGWINNMLVFKNRQVELLTVDGIHIH